MAQYTPIPLATRSAQGRSNAESAERLLNFYVKVGKKGPVLYPRPGLKAWTTVGDGPIRGIRKMGGKLFVVSGGKLYSVDNNKNATELGDIAGLAPVRMTDNRVHLLIATTSTLYAANETVLQSLPESGMNGVGYMDGYGIMSQAGTEFVWITGLDDFTTIGGADFTSADRAADLSTGLTVHNGLVYAFGEETIEVLRNTGNALFPFERVEVISKGTESPGSIAQGAESIFFVGQDLRVYQLQGYQPAPISDDTVERFLDTAAVEACEAFVFHLDGNTFYQMSFSTGTWVYNTRTQSWSEWKTHGIDRWRAQGYSYFEKQHLVGDYADNNIYELDLDTYDDNGAVIRREAILPPLEAEGTPLSVNELLVSMETGVGLVSGQGSDPELMLDWSDDDAHTWKSAGTAKIGKIGKYNKEVRFQRLGQFRRRRHYRLAITDPVKTVILGAKIRAEAAVA